VGGGGEYAGVRGGWLHAEDGADGVGREHFNTRGWNYSGGGGGQQFRRDERDRGRRTKVASKIVSSRNFGHAEGPAAGHWHFNGLMAPQIRYREMRARGGTELGRRGRRW